MLKQGVNFIMTDNKIEQETKENVISYHTFIFPFTWGVGDIKRREFIDIVNKTENFVTDNKSESMLLGNYFTKSARRAIYNEHESDTDEPVWNYILKPEKLNGAKFIVSGTEKDITRNYELELNAIRFKIFNTGAAALVYEVKNTRYNEYNDILKINNWGSRLFTQFVGVDIDIKNLTDDKIQFEMPYKSKFILNGEDYENHISFLFSDKITINKANSLNGKKLYINPILDERMFVCCLLKDDEFMSRAAEYKNGNYDYITSSTDTEILAEDNVARKLHELTFVDFSGVTCKSKNVLKETMQNHIYERWIENGNIYGASSKALISVAKESVPDFTINSFLSYYVEIAILVLMQRTTLMQFEEELGAVIANKTNHKIANVQENYIKFNAQFLLREISAKPQAIELYALLKDCLYIDVHRNEIEKQINSCLELEIAKDNQSRTTILSILSLFGVVGVINDVWGWLDITNFESLLSCEMLQFLKPFVNLEWFGRLFPTVLSVAVVFVLYMWFHNRKIKKRFKEIKKKRVQK